MTPRTQITRLFRIGGCAETHTADLHALLRDNPPAPIRMLPGLWRRAIDAIFAGEGT